ncbi:MBL fold metallo-hydrolase [Streptomyces sp. NPDC091287]|uniref:MBL fold metallo-hydrolase n=1 Tax=Streptomyces sp. NPDC091287 TaxID=3365988 RepID=UPI0038205E2B
MKLTHFGHACVLAEFDSGERAVRVLLDPGTYSADFEDLTDLDAILLTHEHPDHLDPDRITQLAKTNPAARIIADPGAGDRLREAGLTPEVARPGENLTIATVTVEVLGGEHAVIHPNLPCVTNNAYLLDGRLLHPGDAFTIPPSDKPLDVLLVPAAGPWMKASEAIDYLRRLAPRVAVPIHQGGLAEVHRDLHHQLLTNLAPDGTRVEVLEPGTAHTY